MFKRRKSIGDRLKKLFSIGLDTDEFYEELEDRFIEADIAARTALELSGELREEAGGRGIRSVDELREFIAAALVSKIRTVDLDPTPGGKYCYLFLGVNGVGKTTSIAKLAHRWKALGRQDIILAAGDTFRAAASEQLGLHAKRLDLRCVSQGHGADPAAVIYDAIDSAFTRDSGIVMADTAGRMHSKANLVKELEKIDKVVRSRIGDAIYRKILVLDATTGQNGLQQAEVFHEAVGVDGIVLSKYDSNAKGGLALSISRQLDIPFAYMGKGEGYDDLIPFDSKLLGEKILSAIEGNNS